MLRIAVYIFGLILSLTFTPCVSAESMIPSLNLSEISNKDISSEVHYFSLNQSTSNYPRNTSQIKAWLHNLTEHKKTRVNGDKYAVIFEIYNDTDKKDWFIYPYGSVVEHITIIQYDANTRPVIYETGYNVANQQDFHYGADFNILPQQRQTVVMVFDSDYFFAPIKILIQPKQHAKHQFHIENVILLVSLGICLALALYNLFIYASVRNKQYLTYALSTLAYAFAWSTIFAVPQYLGFNSQTQLITPMFIVGMIFTSLFSVQFLSLQKKSPKTMVAFKIFVLVAALCLPVAFVSQGTGIILVSLLSTVLSILGLYAGIQRWLSGYIPARYFVLAYVALVVPNLAGSLINFGILPTINVNVYLLGLIGNCLDSLLLAFALAHQLKLLTEKNLALTATLEQKVDQRTRELKEANLELEKTNANLIEASEAKGRFLATMSHEIRTPLTSIIGYADGILLGDIDKSEQSRVVKIISQNGNHLLSVINDILDISKIEADKLDFETLPTPLFSILAEIESIVGKRSRDKGLAFHIEYQYPLPASIYTDPTRLKQILFNLTNNAIKFTEQGFIGLGVHIENDRLNIQVKDSGVGVTAQQQKELFEPFTQADSSINRRFGGTGLGLSISQRLAQGLQGEITLESTPRKGSTFTVNLPLQQVENTGWINNASEIWESTPARAVKPEVLPDFSGQKVLLADDHPANRELISVLLKRMELDVVEAEDGKQVLETLFYQSFDLVLLDIHMPKMDGTEALKQIRKSGNHTPVIALTANNMKHEIEHYMRMGFSAHLAKPISRKHFIEVLSRYLTQKDQLESPILPEDMLKLIGDYAVDLDKQIHDAQLALEQRDMALIGDIAHRIKGSAGAFGFDLLSKKFADIEHSAMQDDEIAVSYELPKILALAQVCVDLPGVDIAKGIINNQSSVELFLKRLHAFIYDSEQIFDDLKAALSNNEINSALVHLYKLLPTAKDCALNDSITAFTSLETLITSGDWQTDQYTYLLTAIEQHIKSLRNCIPQQMIYEI